jgi:hypothetical protein
LIVTVNYTSLGYLLLIINISDTCKNQSKRLDFDDTINLSSLIVILESAVGVGRKIHHRESSSNPNFRSHPTYL